MNAKEAKDTIQEALGVQCHLCKVINPQHKDCTECRDMEAYRAALSILSSLVEENEKARAIGQTYEEYIHSGEPEREQAEADARYNKPVSRRHHCWEIFKCPKVEENAALKGEAERLTRDLGIAQRKATDLDGLLSKKQGALKETQAELDAARPLLEAASELSYTAEKNILIGTKIVICPEDQRRLNKAALAYREGKEKP